MYIYIRSMAEAKNKIYNKLTAKAPEINKHIIKLILFPNHTAYNHWKQEIYSFANQVQFVKGKNKFPKEKFILECLSIANDQTERYIDWIVKEYKDSTPEYAYPGQIQSAIEEYQKWVAHELSTQGFIVSYDAYDKLDEIVNNVGKW